MSDVDERWQKLIAENEYLREQERYLTDKIERGKRSSNVLWKVSSFMFAFAGFGMAMVAAPSLEGKKDCNTFKVERKPVTAFVLKPPEGEKCEPKIIEKACPVAEKEPEVTPVEEPTKRKYRKRRIRRYWR